MPDDIVNKAPIENPEEAKADLTEKTGSDAAGTQPEDDLVDEWEVGSFPASDPPENY